MTYDQHLADRIRDELADHSSVTERKMFGGLRLDTEEVDTAPRLRRWIDLSVDFVATLPAKHRA
ncbi:MAG: hypothetical protein ABIV94_06960 [Acidimicrobiales bacterium]